MKADIFKTLTIIVILVYIITQKSAGQPVPGKDENIPFLVTFGKNGETSWGDDDFFGVFLYDPGLQSAVLHKSFDPDVGGRMMRYRVSGILKQNFLFTEGKVLILTKMKNQGV